MTTRLDVAESVVDLFFYGPATREELVQYAEDGGAPHHVLDALERLPDQKFARLSDLWPHLPDLPDLPIEG
ncbi:DUF2795 domain-containing protein [Promicromonospora sp. NPDC023987]|uniref:DUF2795 domain-containing protein n=1 Tax=Promicromonospora sp. NPDC023987 TaxID=3155360 RepID=UPI0033C872BF